MRWKVKVSTKKNNLYIRTGPSKSYKIKGRMAPGTEFIVNDRKVNNGWEWLKHESTGYWSCKREPGYNYDFILLVEDLDPPKPPTPVPEPTPAPAPEPTPPKPLPPKTDTITENTLSGGLFGSAGDVDWHQRVSTLEEEKLSSSNNSRMTRSSVRSSNSYDYSETKLKADMEKIYYNLDLSYGKSGFYTGLMPQLFHNFNRYGIEYADRILSKTFPHVFFTRPDINVLKSDGTLTSLANSDDLFHYVWDNNKDIIRSLTQFYSNKHQFNTFIHNNAKSFEVSDEFIKASEHGETFTGNKIQYGKSDIESRAAGEFSIVYNDDANLNVYKMHKIWVDYISKVFRGHFYPRKDYMMKKTLDYACAAYYILCGPDGETILFWSKYFGVFPTNVPSSTLSWSKGNVLSNPEMSINYSYSFKEDFDPVALAEFNELCATKAKKSKARSNYDKRHGSMGSTRTGAPYIDSVTVNGRKVFKLKWRDENEL
ncbi:SH3 domain-containing protein [Romboutsia ilealis]|uniref:SH3 domain-containing protein n=1 Tax=Romboutsia ilealis TaxID=1115758 RepID=UPI002729F3E1|nr:SH3 domain-containing protein [Romboutsia ilealis]